MRYQDMKKRKRIDYKIKMWLYRLTFLDVKNTGKFIINIIAEFLLMGIGFIILCILPAFFH